MNGERDRRGGPRALDLVEEAIEQVRSAPSAELLAYYIGAIPFVLGLLGFLVHMSRGAFAWRQLGPGSLRVALLFLWMKAWQTAYAARLRARLSGADAPFWGLRRVLRMAALQAAVQPLGLVLLPAALLAVLPFGHVYAFFNNVTVLGDGGDRRFVSVLRAAGRQAWRWPGQNLLVLWLVSPWPLGLGFFAGFALAGWSARLSGIAAAAPTAGMLLVFLLLFAVGLATLAFSPLGFCLVLNFSVILAGVPLLLRAWFGVETLFAMHPFGMVFNTTFPLVVFGLCYLCLDPALKAAYTLRCFHGDAMRNGADLSVAVRRHRAARVAAALAAWILLAAAPSLRAGAPPADPAAGALDPATLDGAIARVLEQREFSWRSPRVAPAVEDREMGGPARFRNLWTGLARRLERALVALDRRLEALHRWWTRRFAGRGPDPASPAQHVAPWDWGARIRVLLFVVLSAAGAVLGLLLFRLWRRRRRGPAAVPAPPRVSAESFPDTDASADALPPDEWAELAQRLFEQGDLRQALRAFHMAMLACLARAGRLALARHKSNRDYARELQRRAHDRPEVLAAFRGSVTDVERCWYGPYPATVESVERCRHCHARVEASFPGDPAFRGEASRERPAGAAGRAERKGLPS